MSDSGLVKFRVHKVRLNPGKNAVRLPLGCRILSVAVQEEPMGGNRHNNRACLWAMVQDRPLVDHHFFVLETGREVELNSPEFIGAATTRGGEAVFHVFRVQP